MTDIELRALAGVLVKGFNIQPNNRLGDGVDFNDRAFLRSFPYMARPSTRSPISHHRTEPGNAAGDKDRKDDDDDDLKAGRSTRSSPRSTS